MIQIISIILWYIFASLCGSVEAILWSKKAAEAFKWNEHILLVLQRGLVILICISCYFLELNIFTGSALIISAMLSFSFFHNGFYYFTRSKIDVPTYNFTSNSTSSTAKLQFPFIVRLIMFIFSIIILISIFTSTI